VIELNVINLCGLKPTAGIRTKDPEFATTVDFGCTDTRDKDHVPLQ